MIVMCILICDKVERRPRKEEKKKDDVDLLGAALVVGFGRVDSAVLWVGCGDGPWNKPRC